MVALIIHHLITCGNIFSFALSPLCRYEPYSLLISLIGAFYGVFKSMNKKILWAGSLHKYKNYPFGTSLSFVKRLIFYFSLYFKVICHYIYSRFFIDRENLDLLLTKPFFAFFPSYQIEYTSLPTQGWDFSHLRCIDKIFSHIPDGCNLITKDHPWTFSFISSSLTARNQSYYRSVLKYGINFLQSTISPYQIFLSS